MIRLVRLLPIPRGRTPAAAPPRPAVTRVATTGDLLAEIAAAETLAAAWKRVRANGGAPGGDGVDRHAFQPRAEALLARLRHDLAHQCYRPGPVRRVDIAKPDGGTRTLSIPCLIDRVAQTAAAMVLGRRLDPGFSDDSYGYRPGRTVETAITRVAVLRRAGFRWVIDGDIRAFFDSVPHRGALGELLARTGDRRIAGLIALWLRDTPAPGIGLPQGLPVSPLLANLVLDPIDRAVARWPGCKWLRYADDFLLLCRSRRDAERGLAGLDRLLGRAGLALHPDKTRILRPTDPVFFLGYAVQDRAARPPAGGPAPPGKTPPWVTLSGPTTRRRGQR